MINHDWSQWDRISFYLKKKDQFGLMWESARKKTKKRKKNREPPKRHTHCTVHGFCIEYTKGLYSPLALQQINIIAKCYFFPFISINRDSLYRSRKGKLALRHRRTLKSSCRSPKYWEKAFFSLLPCNLFSLFFFPKQCFLHCDFSHFQLFVLLEIPILILFFLLHFFTYTYIFNNLPLQFLCKPCSIVATLLRFFIFSYIGISEFKKIIQLL